MIKISVLYPNHEGAKFDMAYYCQTHMPLVQRLLGPAMKGMSVDQGMGGFPPVLRHRTLPGDIFSLIL